MLPLNSRLGAPNWTRRSRLVAGFSRLVRRPAVPGAPLTLSSPPKAALRDKLGDHIERHARAAEHRIAAENFSIGVGAEIGAKAIPGPAAPPRADSDWWSTATPSATRLPPREQVRCGDPGCQLAANSRGARPERPNRSGCRNPAERVDNPVAAIR